MVHNQALHIKSWPLSIVAWPGQVAQSL